MLVCLWMGNLFEVLSTLQAGEGCQMVPTCLSRQQALRLGWVPGRPYRPREIADHSGMGPHPGKGCQCGVATPAFAPAVGRL